MEEEEKKKRQPFMYTIVSILITFKTQNHIWLLGTMDIPWMLPPPKNAKSPPPPQKKAPVAWL